jgi:hypothetical protein
MQFVVLHKFGRGNRELRGGGDDNQIPLATGHRSTHSHGINPPIRVVGPQIPFILSPLLYPSLYIPS